MARLSVNVDHVATVRQARGTNEPDPVIAAGLAEMAGADGIICHLREDRRHIQDRDLELLRKTVKTRLNMEMACVEGMLEIALRVHPELVTLVPERREELTTEGGLDVLAKPEWYLQATHRLKGAGIEVSFFVDPDERQIQAAHDCGGHIVEIHTGGYAGARTEREALASLERISAAARKAVDLGMGVSAGHGLTYSNIKRFKAVPLIQEYSIGHSIVSMSVLVGMEKAVRDMVALVGGF